MNIRHTLADTELGPITIVASAEAITGLYFAHHIRRPAQQTFGPHVDVAADPLLAEATRQLAQDLGGTCRAFTVPLDADGDTFQHTVWDVVRDIPFGATTTYGEIAETLGDRALAYRVGQAVGANPLCVFVPCHRVVGATGALTGYAGGLARKRALLKLEEPAASDSGRLF